MNLNQKMNSLIEILQKNSLNIYSIICCKDHELAFNNITIGEVSCEVCKEKTIHPRSWIKLVAEASAQLKEITKSKKEKATKLNGDIIRGKLITVRENGVSVLVIILIEKAEKSLLDEMQKEISKINLSISFTPEHQTKRAGEKRREIKGKMAKQKEKPEMA
jgi:hypothetical protein